MNIFQKMAELLTFNMRGSIIEQHIRKNKDTLYGAQAIRYHSGIFARPTSDYDVKSRNAKRNAMQLGKDLDRRSMADVYFEQESKFHKGTYKVIYKGEDHKPNTKDDVAIADFTQERHTPYRNFSGIRVVGINSIKHDKRKAISDPQFQFRHEKDREDLFRINLSRGKFK